jgi:PQQ-dependent dehydrogenase (methanol/ethanol family)
MRNSTSLIAIAVAGGMSVAALANDDVLKLSKDPANVVMPSITYNGWNYSELNQITLANVKNLQVAWTWQVGVLDSHEASPLVVGDTMYIVSPKPNYVYALDLKNDGIIKWEFRPTMDVAVATAQTCCGAQTRALYYAEGKIFYATLDGQIIALDAKSGEQLWHNVGTDIVRGEGMAGNGLIIKNLFVVGNEGGERGARGKVHAYDINTGKQAWTMYNMGPNNEVGIGPKFKPFYPDDKIANPALDSWFGDSWKRGGGTSWGYFTWDPDLNIFYYSTGNCGPWNPDYRREWGKYDVDENGGMNKYKSNYCASQMARDATTGELIWAYNITPADPWDLDEPLITPLIDLDIGGSTKKTAVKAARDGYLYVWDRATGQLLQEPFMHTYTDVNLGVNMTTGRPKYDAAKWMFTNVEDRRKYTQSDPRGGGATKPAGYTGTEVEWCPGTSARNWENDAWSPQTKLLYTHTDNSCAMQIVIAGDYKPGEGYTLRQTVAGVTATMKGLDGKETKIRTDLKAFDIPARKIAWSLPNNDNSRTPQMATAGGLVFKGLNDLGAFQAINAATGKTEWQFRTGSRFNQSPITYLYGGKQYVAIIASSAAANTAVGAAAAADDANRYRRSGTTMYVFKLPG